MCNPAIIPIVTALFSASQQNAQGHYAKGVADYNTRVTENAAQDLRNEGTEAENIQRQRTAELMARQRVQLAANNIDLSSGSALQLQEDTGILGEADALRIRSNYTSKINSLGTQASLIKSQGDMALAAGRNNAGGTLLAGAGNVLGSGVADKWFTSKSAAKQG